MFPGECGLVLNMSTMVFQLVSSSVSERCFLLKQRRLPLKKEVQQKRQHVEHR